MTENVIGRSQDLRSANCVMLSHCILAQVVRANGLAKYFAGAVKPVVQFCLENAINIIKMPCPEWLCAAGGLGRDPHGKAWYEKNGLRETAREIARGQAGYAKQLVDNGMRVLAIIGVEFSPACAVSLLNKGQRIQRGQGIYVEELKTVLKESGLIIPFIGVNQRALKKLERDLGGLLPAQAPARN